MKSINEDSFLGIPWIVCGVISVAISVFYYFVWPKELQGNMIERLIIRYFHSIVWILLAFSAFIIEFKLFGGFKTAGALAKLSLILYLILIFTYVIKKV